MDNEYIVQHAKTLVDMEGSGLFNLFHDDKIEDIKRMYNLFLRVPTTLDLVRECLGMQRLYMSFVSIVAYVLYVHIDGISRGTQVTGHMSSLQLYCLLLLCIVLFATGKYIKDIGLEIVADNDNIKDPMQFVEKMLTLRGKVDVIIDKCCQGDKKCHKKMKDSFEEVRFDIMHASFIHSFIHSFIDLISIRLSVF